MAELGKKNWVFCDGDLPPKTDPDLEAHESLMILNMNDTDAHIKMTFYFEDRDPIEGVEVVVEAKRVRCFRLDRPIGDVGTPYQIPFGQYALVFNSDQPVFSVFGRLDTRKPNMAFYTVQGHNY